MRGISESHTTAEQRPLMGDVGPPCATGIEPRDGLNPPVISSHCTHAFFNQTSHCCCCILESRPNSSQTWPNYKWFCLLLYWRHMKTKQDSFPPAYECYSVFVWRRSPLIVCWPDLWQIENALIIWYLWNSWLPWRRRRRGMGTRGRRSGSCLLLITSCPTSDHATHMHLQTPQHLNSICLIAKFRS